MGTTNLIADGKPPSAEVDVEEHLLIRIDPGPVVAVEYLHRHRCIPSQVPTVYTALPAVGRIQHVRFHRVELELHHAGANVANPSHGMRWRVLVVERDVGGCSGRRRERPCCEEVVRRVVRRAECDGRYDTLQTVLALLGWRRRQTRPLARRSDVKHLDGIFKATIEPIRSTSTT